MEETYALELRDISKRFGSVQANDHVNLTLRKSEILAILGENGSGKTTLMNMIYGIYYPDEGHIYRFVAFVESLAIRPLNNSKYFSFNSTLRNEFLMTVSNLGNSLTYLFISRSTITFSMLKVAAALIKSSF